MKRRIFPRGSDVESVQVRLDAASGERWELTRDLDGRPAVRVVYPGGLDKVMRVCRDADDASPADVDFVAHSRQDLQYLLDARAGGPCSDDHLDAIAARADRASSGPWNAFLEEEGGMGGESVIWITNNDVEPDMYLRFASKLAPSDDLLLVGEARQDIPRLLAEVRASRDIARH